MKYNRTALINRVKEQVAKLEGKDNPDMSEYNKELANYKLTVVDDAVAYLASVKRWAKQASGEKPSLAHRYSPQAPYKNHETAIQGLKAMVTQLELCAEDKIEIRENGMFRDMFFYLNH